MHVSIEISKEFPHASTQLSTITNPLKLEDLQSLCERDTTQMSNKFQSIQDNEKTRIAFKPSHAQISWHLNRAEFVSNILLQSIPHQKGAITEGGSSWVCWDHDLRASELVIIRMGSLGQV